MTSVAGNNTRKSNMYMPVYTMNRSRASATSSTTTTASGSTASANFGSFGPPKQRESQPVVAPAPAPVASQGPAWLDWIETCGAELFGCDDECTGTGLGRVVLGDALAVKNSPNKEHSSQPVNFEALHDEFLESLLLEQADATNTNTKTARDDDSDKGSANWTLDNVSSMSLSNSVSMDSSTQKTDNEESENGASPSTRKRRRAVKLPKHHVRRGNGKVAPNQQQQQQQHPNLPPRNQHEKHSSQDKDNSSSSASTTLNLAELSRTEFPDPRTYLHPLCRMQKDKGKGEAVGSNICAKGRDACLEKLRTKMQLLTEIAMQGGGALTTLDAVGKKSAMMKRRKAKISERCENFTETRSLIELRMGFLSMQYGVLLRWDTSRTRVTLVVLRKMCHSTFYPVHKSMNNSAANMQQQPMTNWSLQESSSPQVRDVVGDKHAILQRPDGTEVTLLEPPYRVKRPEHFEPTVLEVSVLFASGLSRRSNWTVQLNYDTCTQNILLGWDPELGCLSPKLGDALKHGLLTQDLDLSCLEIKLFEHRLRRKNQRRLVSTMKVPLTNLKAQPSVGGKASRMKIPCQDDHDASIALDLLLKSDYAHWLNKELDARRREEVSGFSWRAAYFVPDKKLDTEEQEEENDPWEWICSVC